MRVLFALLIISTAVATLQAADPLACTAVNYQGAFNDQDQFDVTSTGNFVLSVQNGTTYVTASNIQVINWKTRDVATGVCYYGICCNITMNNSCTFDVRDTYVLLYANFSNGVAFTTFTGLVADDNTFSTTKLFGQNNMCLNSFMNENGTTSNNTICCTASQPAPVASTSNKNCKRFTSRTTIYDVQNNFNIFATTSLTYDLIGRTLIPSNFTDQATDYFVCYFDHTFFNNPLSCDEKGVVTYANITIPDGDIKFLISAFYLPNSLDIFGINGILNARLLYRNGQLLMQEGVPFTPQNNCAYFKDIWFPNPSKYTTTAQLCCTDFES